MRERKVRILHDGHELFLVDSVQEGADRTITVLRRVNEGEALHADARVVLTDIGDCVAVARWHDGRLEAEPEHAELTKALEPTLARYVEEFRVGRRRSGTTPYFFLSSARKPLFELNRAQPHGLAVLVYTNREKAETEARARRGIESPDVEIETTGDLGDFLLARASEGFVGATVDGRDPIYFCSDDAGDARFLRLSMDDRGRLQQTILGPDGTFQTWDGEEDLNPEIDLDASDRNMVEKIGDRPFLGFHENTRFLRLERRTAPGEAVRLDGEDDEGSYYPVFCDTDLAEAFLADQRRTDLVTAPITDLRSLAGKATAEGVTLRLHPGAHRAYAGTLWVHDDDIVLDSFSGLWRSSDGRAFQKT